jgi:pimeloyl-ACP methyl ester carboxylesterase
VRAGDVRAVGDGITGASTSTFPGAGHLIGVERPERFVAEVRAFLLGA